MNGEPLPLGLAVVDGGAADRSAADRGGVGGGFSGGTGAGVDGAAPGGAAGGNGVAAGGRADRDGVSTDEAPVRAEVGLRRRVHAALDANVLPDDQRDDTELLNLVFDELGLTDLERLSAQSYVRSWLVETRTGERIRTA